MFKSYIVNAIWLQPLILLILAPFSSNTDKSISVFLRFRKYKCDFFTLIF